MKQSSRKRSLSSAVCWRISRSYRVSAAPRRISPNRWRSVATSSNQVTVGSPADGELEAHRDAAEVILPGLFRNPAFAQNAGHVCVLHVSRNADPAAHTQLNAARRE